MPEASGAAGQLERVLYILPRAAREGGASLAELSESLGVEIPVVLKDLTQVTARAYYHPAGGEELLLEIEGGRVNLFTPGAFRRPVRLSMLEAVCLGLALRGRLAGRWGKIAGTEGPSGILHLLRALETTLSTVPSEDFLARIEAADLRPDPAGIREILSVALEERKACRIQYLKPGDEEPEDRTIWPYAMVHGEGHWYLLAHCARSKEVRRFRLDRVLDAETTGEGFPVPEDFDPGAHVQGGRVFRGDETMEVRVRYSPVVARWVAEQEAAQPAPDGSLTLTHPVADPHWIVRHVLQYGPEAEVLDPAEARGWVRGAVECWTGTP
ncbi:MAG: WYL domain-containing protein [Gemmatimonadota bacterium]|jgi:proteasome accessory factor C